MTYSRAIIALGDSLTEGYGVLEVESYPALLEKKFQTDGGDYQVINAGISGECSRGILGRLDRLPLISADVVILETGINDILQGIEPAQIKDNLDAIITFFQGKDITVLLTGMKLVWDFGFDHTHQFDNLYLQLADKYGLVFMPFFLQDVALQPYLSLGDGLHPNAKGYEIITDNLYPYVRESIERQQKR